MAGHNKWSKIKRLKGALDVKRGQLFSRLSKEIVVAVKLGGGDSSTNPRLRAAIQGARAQSMPNDNIDRAIKKGTGESGAQAVEEILYEGYAPGGVALIVEAATDNKNRTAADMRLIFTKNEGQLANTGSVSFLFHRKGQITVPLDAANEDRILEVVLEAGAEELESDDEQHLVTTPPDQLYAVAGALKAAGMEPDSEKLIFIPQNSVSISDEPTADKIVHLCDALEDCDDVLAVHSNFKIPEDLLACGQDN
jgi:YebC/PmpR family DNA-binding regulatory protein